jgi:hypothetical protein
MKKISVLLDEDLHHEIKVHCVEVGLSIQDFVLKAITVASRAIDKSSEGGATLEDEVMFPLTRSDQKKVLAKAEKIFKSDDPLAIDLLRATIAFYGAHLPDAQEQDSPQG